MTRLGIALLFYTLGIGCGRPSLPPPISDQEILALGVTQGIAGRAAVRGGDCFGCEVPITCKVGPVSLMLYVLEAEPPFTSPASWPSPCFINGGPGGGFGSPLPEPGGHPATIAVEDLGDDDLFAIRLEPGIYQVVLVDQEGCATAYPYWLEADGGVLTAQTVTVEPGAVTRFDVLYDVSVH